MNNNFFMDWDINRSDPHWDACKYSEKSYGEEKFYASDFKYNPWGVFVTRDGDIYQAINQNTVDLSKKITPRVTENDYLFIADEDVENISGCPSNYITDKSGISIQGKLLHRIVVFAFGDCKGRKYNSNGVRSIIDHLDMNKSNNSVNNLQIVSEGINLFRAYYKTGSKYMLNKLNTHYNSLSETEKIILKDEIKLDLRGEY